ncbi:hypothetical protein FIBSPDRAFT_750552, partial [Athelia psychrophila]
WQSYTHPEGAKYFHRAASTSKHISTVTDADIYNAAILAKVNAWTKVLESALRATGVDLTSPSIELFLEPCEDLTTCGYYLVDHGTRSEFWVNQITSELLDLGQVVSTSHLKTALEVQYWDHVQYYPMHYDYACASRSSLDELLGVLCHGMTDRMTSTTSTFGYSPEECEKYISLIKTIKEQPSDGHLTWVVGRIWFNIAYCRFYSHFGEDMVRLNRNQAIFPASPIKDHKLLQMAEYLSFGLSGKHDARFQNIFVDERVDGSDFRSLVADCLDDWKSSLVLCLPLLAANMLLSFVPATSNALWLSSMVLCGTSVMIATMLSTKFQGLRKAVAEEGYYYLSTLQSETYGFKPAAIVFALPRALSFWSLGLVLLQAIVLTHSLVNNGVALGLLAMVLLVLLCTAQVLSESHGSSPCAWISGSWNTIATTLRLRAR